jgi:hypothetical protein
VITGIKSRKKMWIEKREKKCEATEEIGGLSHFLVATIPVVDENLYAMAVWSNIS